MTRARQLQEEVEEANRELETAYEELQSSTEELETTNEELQSINEELETTNEELQSSNEELETTNEELQSTNEELQTVNDEMRLRSAEMDRLTAFLNSVMAALPGGVVVVNPEMLVQVWGQKAEDMWGLRADEALGKHFLDIDIGLPLVRLRQPVRACLAGESDGEQLVLDAINRRGPVHPVSSHLLPAARRGRGRTRRHSGHGRIVRRLDDNTSQRMATMVITSLFPGAEGPG